MEQTTQNNEGIKKGLVSIANWIFWGYVFLKVAGAALTFINKFLHIKNFYWDFVFIFFIFPLILAGIFGLVYYFIRKTKFSLKLDGLITYAKKLAVAACILFIIHCVLYTLSNKYNIDFASNSDEYGETEY